MSTVFEAKSGPLSKRPLRDPRDLDVLVECAPSGDGQDVVDKGSANDESLQPQCSRRAVLAGDGEEVVDKGSANGESLQPQCSRRAVLAGDRKTCHAHAYKQGVVTACFQKKRRRDPEVFERHGRHDFDRPISSFVARKLRHKGIFKMCLKNLKCDESIESIEFGEPGDRERSERSERLERLERLERSRGLV